MIAEPMQDAPLATPPGPVDGRTRVPRVSLLIPAYNEANRIESCVAAYHDALVAHYGEDFEMLVLANGCSDNTFEIAQQLAGRHPHVIAHETKEKIGKGGAVLWGFNLSRGRAVAFADADGSTSPASLLRLLDRVEAEADAAIGSRWLPDSVISQRQPLNRRALSRVFNLLVRVLLGLSFRDTQCGAKAFRGELVRGIDRFVQGHGWAFDVELLLRLRQRYPGIRIEEVPIEWNDTSGSRLRAHRDGPSMLRDLVRLARSKPVPPATGASDDRCGDQP